MNRKERRAHEKKEHEATKHLPKRRLKCFPAWMPLWAQNWGRELFPETFK